MAGTETPNTRIRQIPQSIQDNARARRVILSPVPAPATTPKLAHAAAESVTNHAQEIFIQCLYMVPVVGNAMSLWDVGADIYRICSQPGAARSALQWGILIIDAVGVVPAAGNVSRPARAVAKEVLLAFAKGAGAAVLVDLFWATAGGDVHAFMAKFDEHLNRWKKDIIDGVRTATRTIRRFVQSPVSAAEQMGAVKKNTGFLSWVPSTEEIALYGIDELLELSGQRAAILAWLDEFERNTEPMINEALGEAAKAGTLLFMAAQVAAEIKARKRPSHTAQAVPGTMTEPHRKPGEHRDTTQKGAAPSTLPARDGCGCPATASKKPVNFAMGDENLEQTDFVLDGVVPIAWTRRYRSSLAAYDDSPIGARWSSPYHLSLAPQDDGSLLFFDPDNRPVPLPAIAVGETVEVPAEQLSLHRPDARQLQLAYPDGSSENYRLLGTRYRLASRRGRDGLGLAISYDECGQITGITDGADSTIRLDYIEGRVAAILRLDRSGGIVQTLARYAYGPTGDLVRHEDVLGHARTFAYEQHLLVHYTDFNGNGHHLEWAWPGRAQGLPLPADAKCVRTWIGQDERDIRDDTRFEYHREHWYTQVTDASGNATYHRYDYHNRIVLVEHPDGSSERFTWDEHNNLASMTNAEGQTQRFAYDAQGRVSAVTDALGNTTRTDYDAAGLPVKVTAPTGEAIETAYDELGRPVSVIDPSGRVTQYAWSNAGQLLAITDPKGGVREFDYDQGGRLTCARDCSGFETRYAYDANGYLLRRTDAEGQATGFRHDASGQLLARTHPDGTEERFAYDGEGNLTTYTDGAGQVTSYSYNARYQPTLRRDAAGRELWYLYDPQWRLARLRNENGEYTRFTYDAVGQLASETGFDDRTVYYSYDAAGRLTGAAEDDSRTEYGRDPRGRLTSRTVSAKGRLPVEERFYYDAHGRLTTASTAYSTVQLHHDEAGDMIAELQRIGMDSSEYVTVSRHEYDALGHRTQTMLPDTRTVGWQRYGSGHVHGVLLDGQPLLEVERDRLHREVSRQHRNWCQTRTYDTGGRLAELAVRQGTAEVPGVWMAQRRLQYSQAGHLTRIEDRTRGATEYAYDPVGRLLKAVSPDLTEVFAFDPAGNPVDPDKIPPRPAVESNEGKAQRHAREAAEDAAWLRAHPGEKYPPPRFDQRGAEDRQKLDAWQRSLPRCVGNVLRELTRTRYEHDAYGNLVLRVEPDGTTWCYEYDAANRLTQASRYARESAANERQPTEDPAAPALQVRFAYDAFGRRTQKTVEHPDRTVERTLFTWDGDLLLMEERFVRPPRQPGDYQPYQFRGVRSVREDPEDEYSLPVAQRIHTLDEANQWQGASLYLHEAGSFVPLARLDETLVEAAFLATGTDGQFVQVPAKTRHATLFYQNDHLGTPQELVDETGKVVWLARYKAWGGLKASRPPAHPAETGNAIRFPGQYHDAETGLHYNRHRYYDPVSGRFVSKDPIGLAGGINTYQYALNPVAWIDPLGLMPCPGRKGAFRQAKRDLGIPLNQQSDKVLNQRAGQMGQFNHVMMTGSDGSPMIGKNNQPVWTREYQFTRADGSVVLIQDHRAGHDFGEGGVGDQGPHFNVRPCENPRTGKVPGAQAHYPFGE